MKQKVSKNKAKKQKKTKAKTLTIHDKARYENVSINLS